MQELMIELLICEAIKDQLEGAVHAKKTFEEEVATFHVSTAKDFCQKLLDKLEKYEGGE